MITVWQIIGYSVLGLLCLLITVLLIPVVAHITYGEELRVCVRVLGIAVYRFPNVKKPLEADASFETMSNRLRQDNVGETVRLLKQFAKPAAGAVRRILRAITVDKLCLQLVITGADAAQAAQNTGKVCAVLYPAVTAVQQTVLRIRKRAVTVTPDFLGDTNRVSADITAHIMPLRAVCVYLWIVARFGAITKRNKEVSCHGKQSAESDGPVDR